MAGLAFRDRQTPTFPIDVIEFERSDLTPAKPVGHQQQQDRVVTLADRGAPIDSTQDTVDVIPRDRPRHVRESIHLRPTDRGAQVAGEDPGAIGEPDEHSQHPSALPDRASRQPDTGAFNHERGHQRRGQLRHPGADPMQVCVEPVEMMPILIDRRGAQPSFVNEILDETRHLIGQGKRARRPARRHELSQDSRQHLLDRSPNLFRHRPLRTVAPMMRSDPGRDETLDEPREIGDRRSAVRSGVLTERVHGRDSPPHRLEAIAVLGQPDDVRVDLGPDPRRTQPVDRRRLHEELFQHGQLPLSQRAGSPTLTNSRALCDPPGGQHRL
jgi:hypothetical protein